MPSRSLHRLITTVCAALLCFTGGCATTGNIGNPGESEHHDTVSTAQSEPPTLPERAIPEDALYPLLLAEFALRRKAYDVALDQYTRLAPQLRDAGVSAHTTRLSQFLKREPEALKASQLWVDLEPDNAEGNHTLATLLIRAGRTLEAIPHMATAQREGKPVRFPALLLGFNALDETKQQHIVAGIAALREEFPDHPGVIFTQALAQAELRQFDTAQEHLRTLFALEPVHIQGLVLEAKLLDQAKIEDPLAHLRAVVADNPDNNELRLQYARLLTTQDMAAARTEFETLVADSPRNGDLLLSLALINKELKDYQAAQQNLQQLLKLEQRVDDAHFYLGRIADAQKDNEAALGHYMQVTQGKQFITANNRIGQLLLGAGEKERSRQWFAQQRRAHEAAREQLYALESELLNEVGESSAAMQLLNEGLSRIPESSALRYARAMQKEQANDLPGMERDLRDILARDANNTTALNALGYILADRTNRHEEALALVSKALELQPNEPAILDSMGWVLFRSGRHDEALQYLARAYASFPDAEVAAHLGEVLWMTGKTDQARAIWLRAASKDPDHKILRDTLRRLGVDLNKPESNTP